MYKKVILLSIMLCLLLGSFYLISIAPYHIYNLTITEGVDTKFLKMKPTKDTYYDGGAIEFFNEDLKKLEIDSIFLPLHLGNFEMSLPIKHPGISFIPTIKIDSQKIRLGGDFIDTHAKFHFSFILDREKKFETNLVNQELYLLPYFRNYIKLKTEEDVWKDLFTKKISLPSNEGESFFKSLKILNQYSFQELVYNLFLLNNRTTIFPENIAAIKYDSENEVGLIQLSNDSDSSMERIEKLYLLNQGIIYTITIKTNLNSILAKQMRSKFIKNLKLILSNKDSAIPIYALYKNLEYNERIEQKGMLYLFSAWSHDLSNKEYIRVIIQFLERGKSNIKYLKPFYEFAYKRFGSSFSGNHAFLVETPEEKLKRSMSEELENEALNAAAQGPKVLDEKILQEEKIKLYLQKAKDKKINTDENINELKIE